MRNDVPQAKLGILTAVMVGILTVSVALAWLVTRPPKDTSQDGAEIIAKLADDTLEGYWTGSHWDSCSIGRIRDAQPIAWQIQSRGRESEGMFSGSMVAGNFRPGRRESKWELRTDLSEGRYVGRELDDGGQVVTETRITLTDNEVTVVHSSGGQRVTATTARPDNYVPEGAFPLVLRLVAARGGAATVKMILDEAAIADDGTINFINTRLVPYGDNVVRAEYSRGKLVHPRRGSGFTLVYHLDSDHDYNIDRYENPAQGIIYRRCDRELVTETFHISDEGPAIKAAP